MKGKGKISMRRWKRLTAAALCAMMTMCMTGNVYAAGTQSSAETEPQEPNQEVILEEKENDFSRNEIEGDDESEASLEKTEQGDLFQTGPDDEEGTDDQEEPIEDDDSQINIPELSYQVHVQNLGWMDEVSAGEVAGTTGKSLRLEAIRINLEDHEYDGSIEYRVHVQNIGWQEWKEAGDIAGTEGQALRIEAIQIRLTGELADKFNLVYQVHVESFGWLDQVNSEESAGTQGFGKRMECLTIGMQPADEKTDSSGRGFIRTYTDSELTYWGHVQTVGDLKSVTGGQVLGTTGKSLRMEGLAIELDDSALDTLDGGISYKAHVQDIGWMDWVSDGELAGTTGQSRRVEAIQIMLTGEAAQYYDIYYRCHVQSLGWLGWAGNGASAGTSKLSYRIEAVQIKLVTKGGSAPGSTANCYYEGKNGWFYEGGYKFYYRDGQKVTDVRSIIGAQSSYEIRVNKQMSCVTVYAKDGNNGYIIPVVAFACSPGAATPVGTFYTLAKYRWQALYGAQGQWCTRITGHVLFHSPPYTSFNNHTLWPAEYNKLGTWASAGCIRLRSGDAKWIYDNCMLNTKVVIYNSSVAGPLGKPVYAKIPLTQTWDPTDPTV